MQIALQFKDCDNDLEFNDCFLVASWSPKVRNYPIEYEKLKTIIKDSQASTRKWNATGLVSKSSVSWMQTQVQASKLTRLNSHYIDALKAIKYKYKILNWQWLFYP